MQISHYKDEGIEAGASVASGFVGIEKFDDYERDSKPGGSICSRRMMFQLVGVFQL